MEALYLLLFIIEYMYILTSYMILYVMQNY